MTITNKDVRTAARIADLRQWQIAAKLGIAEETLVRWLRVPLSDERRERIMAAIRELSKKGGDMDD